jgi:hypothetical protein
MPFQLKLPSFLRMRHMFHAFLLEPYHSSTNLGRIHDPPPCIKFNDEHEYEVENILDSRISNHQFQYIVHWHGYDASEHTWEPMKILSNVMEKVHEFLRPYPNKPKAVPCGISH